ncbi:cyc2-like cyclin [Stylonychia lemnae]|uniref:Cyc2-like cyclin n=1 Tax=Stylonychia lemnae TaxID=5949 RepID=A0A078AXA3_STYLE|nr:cyc2-like cyclin [Stylonychia lemnae]|eukprot:CDW87090.1 cyc2-like cyclin [Stylonychia lemnae]
MGSLNAKHNQDNNKKRSTSSCPNSTFNIPCQNSQYQLRINDQQTSQIQCLDQGSIQQYKNKKTRKQSDQSSINSQKKLISNNKTQVNTTIGKISQGSHASQASTKLSDQHFSSTHSDSPQQQQFTDSQKIQETKTNCTKANQNMMNLNQNNNYYDPHNQTQDQDNNYRDIMIQRYQQLLEQVPTCDYQDREVFELGLSSQVAPEYAQEIYQKLLRQEQVNQLRNYLIKCFNQQDYKIAKSLRNEGAKRILSLCKEKGYKQETHFLAVNIMDKFLAIKLYQQNATTILNQEQLLVLVVTATIIAAKVEQPMTPSINRMIKLLSDDERDYVTKEKVIKCEEEILIRFDFDFNILSPQPFVERFMRLSELHNELFIDLLQFEILKVISSNLEFLDFDRSLLAASTLTLCINLLCLNKCQILSQSQGQTQRGIKFDLQQWNDKLEQLTGINQDAIREPFEKLSKSINKLIFSKDDNEIRRFMQNKLR